MADADAPVPREGRNEGQAHALASILFPYYWTKAVNSYALFLYIYGQK